MFVLVSVNTIEEDIQQRADSKRKVDQMVIQAGKFNQKSTEEDRRKGLETIKGILRARMDRMMKGEAQEENAAQPHSARLGPAPLFPAAPRGTEAAGTALKRRRKPR